MGGSWDCRGTYAVVYLTLVALTIVCEGQLKEGFYSNVCPRAEQIVRGFVDKHIPNAPSLAAPLLRMHFHDCFVRGCDGSVLINSTSSNQAEKAATPNQSLRGFGFIDKVKEAVEAECPGTVSCADIIALVARDAVVAIGGPSWSVPTGRRDGTVSKASEAQTDIPAPTNNLTTLIQKFANKTLDLNDLNIYNSSHPQTSYIRAHTIGISHCSSFSARLYNFSGKGDEDPSLDSEYAANLKSRKCMSQNDTTTVVEMDPGSFRTFDLGYYKLLLKRRGLFQSDAALTTGSATKTLVTRLVNASPSEFFDGFAKSMLKMGQVGVLTGSSGEIRTHCAVIN